MSSCHIKSSGSAGLSILKGLMGSVFSVCSVIDAFSRTFSLPKTVFCAKNSDGELMKPIKSREKQQEPTENLQRMSELSRKIWDGSLNVILTLNPNDSNQQERKHEYYLKANRNSYFPLYFPRILQFFEPYLLVSEWASRSNWWLEFEEAPLKWNLQIGLLYDTLTVLDPQRRKDNVWKLTLNYRNYPEDYILPLDSPETLRMTWLNQMKESCYVANGSAKPIMTLSKQNTDELWESVMDANYDMFWNVFPKISPPLEQMKNVPVRIHLSFSNKVIDVPISPLRNGEAVTVGQVLHDQSPDLFPSIRNNILAKAILHGITIPLTTPLAPLYRETLYIDGFIHFSIILMT